MKKLHLVRPRRMAAVRQNLGERINNGIEAVSPVPCSGPAGSADNIRFAGGRQLVRFDVNNIYSGINAPR